MGILTVKGAELAKRVYFLQVRLGGDCREGGLQGMMGAEPRG